MGKGSKTRARAQKALKDIARMGQEYDLAPTPRKPKRGRARMDEINQTSQRETLEVRAKHMGIQPTDENLRAMKAPWLVDEAGRAIAISAPDDVADLWRVVEAWRKAENRFLHHVIGRRMYPGTDSIPHLPTPTETRDDVDYDLRTEEEKVDAAKKAFWAFCEHTDVLNEAQRRICLRGIWDNTPVFTHQEVGKRPRLTFEGAAFVTAIKAVAKSLDMY